MDPKLSPIQEVSSKASPSLPWPRSGVSCGTKRHCDYEVAMFKTLVLSVIRVTFVQWLSPQGPIASRRLMLRHISRRWGVRDIKIRFVGARAKSFASVRGPRRGCRFLVHNETGRISFPDGGFGRPRRRSAGNLRLNFAGNLVAHRIPTHSNRSAFLPTRWRWTPVKLRTKHVFRTRIVRKAGYRFMQ